MKFVKSALVAVVLLSLAQGAALAQAPKAYVPESASDAARVSAAAQPKFALSDTRAIGVGLIIIGAALGIGGLTKSGVESMARQPETAPAIQTAMIISAALIEGVTLLALIIVIISSPY
jgi:F-type H+-transporting ATPase subunit c